jgi:hypothetical protein
MKGFGTFIFGVIVGGWLGYSYALPDRGNEGPAVYLNGGAMISSTVGVIYGYSNDMEGCSIHAAGANFYYQSDEEMQRRIMKAAGTSFCSLQAIK